LAHKECDTTAPPIVVAFVMRARSRLAILGCYALPTATFVAINLSPA
jgi:hypothetical protein